MECGRSILRHSRPALLPRKPDSRKSSPLRVKCEYRAIIAVGQTIRAQATIMGYADSFVLIGVVLLVAVLTVTMLWKGAAAGGVAH
jgi:hypothetical protein